MSKGTIDDARHEVLASLSNVGVHDNETTNHALCSIALSLIAIHDLLASVIGTNASTYDDMAVRTVEKRA